MKTMTIEEMHNTRGYGDGLGHLPVSTLFYIQHVFPLQAALASFPPTFINSIHPPASSTSLTSSSL